MKRTILAVLLSGAFLAACGGGGGPGSNDPATSADPSAVAGNTAASGADAGALVKPSVDSTTPAVQKTPVDAITFYSDVVRTFAGGRAQVAIVAMSADGSRLTDPLLEWSVGDPSIASVTPAPDSLMKVDLKATRLGTTRITVSATPRQQSVDLVVLETPTDLSGVSQVLQTGRDATGPSPVWTDGDPAAQAVARSEAESARAWLNDLFGIEAPPLVIALTHNPYLLPDWVSTFCVTGTGGPTPTEVMACAPAQGLPASWWIVSSVDDLARIRFAHAHHTAINALAADQLPSWIARGVPTWLRHAAFDPYGRLIPGRPSRALIDAYKQLGTSGAGPTLGDLLKQTRAEAVGKGAWSPQPGAGVFVHWLQANHDGALKALLQDLTAGQISTIDASIAWLETRLGLTVSEMEAAMRAWVDRQ